MTGIVIDLSRLVGRKLRKRLPTGIDRVSLAYLKHFRARARAALTVGARALVLPMDWSQRLFDALVSPEEGAPILRTVVDAALRTPLRSDVAGWWFLNAGHTGLHRPGYGSMVASLGVKSLYVIHDLIPLTHPQFCRAPEAGLHARRTALVLRTGAALACNSQATFDALADFADRLKLTIPPAAVALLGSDRADDAALAAARMQPPMAEPYFLMLGTIEPRKNHLLMLQIWQRLVRQSGDAAPRLVLIGQKGWECEHVLRLLERAPELRDHVRWLPTCSDTALIQWMVHARALLFPSFAEGFGLPVLEALERGVPVISADLPVYREFAGDLPEYLDPLDAAAWQAAISEYVIPGSRRRQRRIEALSGFVGPSWADHFARVDDLMARIDARAGTRAPSGAAARAASRLPLLRGF